METAIQSTLYSGLSASVAGDPLRIPPRTAALGRSRWRTVLSAGPSGDGYGYVNAVEEKVLEVAGPPGLPGSKGLKIEAACLANPDLGLQRPEYIRMSELNQRN